MPYDSRTELLQFADCQRMEQDVVDAPSVNTVKNRLDRHWHDMGILSWPATPPINLKYKYKYKYSNKLSFASSDCVEIWYLVGTLWVPGGGEGFTIHLRSNIQDVAQIGHNRYNYNWTAYYSILLICGGPMPVSLLQPGTTGRRCGIK